MKCKNCLKYNEYSRINNCHVNNKIYELKTLFGLQVSVDECASFKQKPCENMEQTMPDSGEK